MILVTGATGTNGAFLVAALRQLGAPVRAFTRDAAKARPLAELGAEIAVGDLAAGATSSQSLAAALAGCERVFILSAVSRQIAEQEGALAQAAKRAGVRHLVKFSANGADANGRNLIARIHGEAEQAIAASGVPWTTLRPTFFMQNLLWAAGSIKREGLFRNNTGKGKAAHVDARDIAAVAARVLTEPVERHAGKTYELRGPQALAYDEIAAIFTQLLGRPVRYVDLTDEAYAQGMIKAGMPEWQARAVAELAELTRTGTAGQTNDVVERIGRKPPTTVEAFLREHRARFVA